MTTFEITIIALLAIIAMLLILAFAGMATINAKMQEGFEHLCKKTEYCDAKLSYIETITQNALQQLDDIESNILDALRDICLTQELDKTLSKDTNINKEK